MKKLLKFFLLGTVIYFIAVPFSFSQQNNKINSLTLHNYSQEQLLNSYISNFSISTIGKYKLNSYEYADSTKQDTLKHNKRVETFHMKKNPWLAVLYSGLFPGAGQFYNHSYWKVPILVGLTVYFGYEFYDQNRQFLYYRDEYTKSQTPSLPEGNPNYKTLREFYRTQRDDLTWYFLLTYFINLVDAYVDAQLFDFNVKEDKIITFGKAEKTSNFRFHFNF